MRHGSTPIRPPSSGKGEAGAASPAGGEPEFLLALVPAYNEEARVGPVVAAARRHLPVLVVDDGSADQTARVAGEAGATVLRQSRNEGKGAALRAGFQRALSDGCAAVVTLDADGQHDPAEIPRFLAAREATGADLVIGERDFARMPPVRRLANALGRLAFSWAVGRPVRDNQSGYRLVSRRLMEALLSSRERGFEFEVEMILVCVLRGWPIAGVPIRTIYAGQPSHIHPLRHLLGFCRMVARTRLLSRRRKPSG